MFDSRINHKYHILKHTDLSMFSFLKRKFRSYDWISFLLICTLAGIGLLFIFSATYTKNQPFSLFFKKQCFGCISSLVIYLTISNIDYRTLFRWGYLGYVLNTGLLLATLIRGTVGMGAKRWISLFFFRFQPSELSKILFPAFLIYHLHTQKEEAKYTIRHFFPILITLLISFVLILKQPDLGTALVFLISGLILLWIAGMQKAFFTYGLLILFITTPLLWQILKPYQKNRISTFLGQGTASKELYHMQQSTIAVGSGGLTGKGFMNGTQNQLLFLPESRTDFIFSVIAEELGFLGSIGVLFLYLLLFIRLLLKASRLNRPLVQLLALGVIMHILLSAFINICMVLGLLPIVGIPLPLISYGLSNLWVTFASLGWFSSIVRHKFYTK